MANSVEKPRRIRETCDVLRKLGFVRQRDWTSTWIDGECLSIDGLNVADARLLARLLQGWIPQNLGLERIESTTVGTPIWKARDGSAVFVAKRLTRVLVELPGGSCPEIDFDDGERLFFDGPMDPAQGVAVAGLDDNDPVRLADISFSRSRAFWHITQGGAPDETWEFTRAQYDAAIRGLLALLGEDPILISQAEWAAPPATRVVPA